jgi:hypothetical protein
MHRGRAQQHAPRRLRHCGIVSRGCASLLLGLAALSTAFAHPGNGVVMDRDGAIYYTDLKQVWQVASDGTQSIVVPRVHTHELYLDADGNLYGEHLSYDGPATDTWHHRVWRRAPDGTVSDIIATRPGFRDDYDDFHFVRDGRGNMYWADHTDVAILRRRAPDGTVATLGEFESAGWITAAQDGTIYLVEDRALKRVTPAGNVTKLTSALYDWKISHLFGLDRHSVMGLWTDPSDNVYAAVLAESVVKKVDRNGRVEVVVRSPPPWRPTGGVVSPNGDLWILEYAGTDARVRRIPQGVLTR